MYFFENDYGEGAHPLLLQRLIETNLEPLSGYGSDFYSCSAKEKIREACACPQAEIQFLVGGTQTNVVVIASLLHRWEGVVAATTGHINTHEAGAVEYSGHKVLALPQTNGKLSSETLRRYLSSFAADANREHMVAPGMVYLSHPTEYGTLYSKSELEELHRICQQYAIPLFIDGARLGYALASPENDLTLAALAEYADVFTIGGTKVGALCGEAVVFPRKAPEHFLTMIKQQGALLAKGRLLGIQFDTLFTNHLYEQISNNAIQTAARLQNGLVEKGYELLFPAATNQIFVVLDEKQRGQLQSLAMFSFWEALDAQRIVVRFATSWATSMEAVEAFLEELPVQKN